MKFLRKTYPLAAIAFILSVGQYFPQDWMSKGWSALVIQAGFLWMIVRSLRAACA